MPSKEVVDEGPVDEPATPEVEAPDELEFSSLFSEHLPVKEFIFRVKGTPEGKKSVVKLRCMSAGANARWRDAYGMFTEKGTFHVRKQESEVVLLCNTIIAMEVFFPKPDGTIEEFRLPREGNARETFYEKMNPQLREVLVGKCFEVNGAEIPLDL